MLPVLITAVLLSCLLPAAPAAASSSPPSIQSIIDSTYKDFVASNPWMGISVGVLAPSSPSPLFFNYGVLDRAALPVTQDTLFSINSMTKVFTALALAESVVAGRVGLNDTVQSHTKHAMPRDGDAEFWLLDLATHWSGLPVRPDNLPNPDYYNYTDDMFFAFMANYSFPELHVRKQYYYSNCAFGLLASVITTMQDQDFRSMCRRLFFSPLSMTLSGLATDPQPAAPYATGHTSNGTTLPRGVSDEAVLGSWAIASTARDMLLFLDAHLRYGSGNSSGGLLGNAVRLAQQPVRPTDDPAYGIGLGWRSQLATNVRLKTGSGDGFESCMMYSVEHATALVVLANTDMDAPHDVETTSASIMAQLLQLHTRL